MTVAIFSQPRQFGSNIELIAPASFLSLAIPLRRVPRVPALLRAGAAGGLGQVAVDLPTRSVEGGHPRRAVGVRASYVASTDLRGLTATRGCATANFIADAMREAGLGRKRDRSFDWCARVVLARPTGPGTRATRSRARPTRRPGPSCRRTGSACGCGRCAGGGARTAGTTGRRLVAGGRPPLGGAGRRLVGGAGGHPRGQPLVHRRRPRLGRDPAGSIARADDRVDASSCSSARPSSSSASSACSSHPAGASGATSTTSTTAAASGCS